MREMIRWEAPSSGPAKKEACVKGNGVQEEDSTKQRHRGKKSWGLQKWQAAEFDWSLGRVGSGE